MIGVLQKSFLESENRRCLGCAAAEARAPFWSRVAAATRHFERASARAVVCTKNFRENRIKSHNICG